MHLSVAWQLALLVCLQRVRSDEALAYVTSTVDHESYLVQESRVDALEASNVLARIQKKINVLMRRLEKELFHQQRVRTFLERSKYLTLQENYKQDASATSYSVNKGESIVLCLQSRNIEGEMVLTDENILFYVVIHELAHIMSDSIGHTKEFGENFKFLLSRAIDWKLYKFEDYRKHPTDYCGSKLHVTPIQMGFGRRKH